VGLGPNKVFISSAWRAYRATPEGRGTTLKSFKRLLVSANRARTISLSRLDLIEAYTSRQFNPRGYRQAKVRVRQSETRQGNATFNFIRLD
jgi:hypothetical protein